MKRPIAEFGPTACYIPTKVATNADFEQMFDTSDEWIRERTGIRERHWASDEETIAFMATEASKLVLDEVPAIIDDAGEHASRKFVEFFVARIRNKNTRAAYGRAVMQFFDWCEDRGLALQDIEPIAVSVYIEAHPGSAPTVKQHLAAIRMLFDHLVVSQVVPFNPAHAVRGPSHVIKKGKTPVLSAEEANSQVSVSP